LTFAKLILALSGNESDQKSRSRVAFVIVSG